MVWWNVEGWRGGQLLHSSPGAIGFCHIFVTSLSLSLSLIGTLSLTRTQPYTHSVSSTLIVTTYHLYTRTLTFTISHLHTLALAQTQSLSLSLSLSLSHTHTFLHTIRVDKNFYGETGARIINILNLEKSNFSIKFIFPRKRLKTEGGHNSKPEIWREMLAKEKPAII